MYEYFSFDEDSTRLFMRFLKKRKVYLQFHTNFMAKNAVEFRYSLRPLRVPRARALLDYAFEWKATPQGYSFWHDVGMKWHDYLYQN